MNITVEYIREKIGDFQPEIGIILGSGLGDFADSFESIINDLENMTNIKFSDEFLNSDIDVYDGIVGDLNSITLVKGIILDFNLNDEEIYEPYYKVIVDDKVYVLNK